MKIFYKDILIYNFNIFISFSHLTLAYIKQTIILLTTWQHPKALHFIRVHNNTCLFIFGVFLFIFGTVEWNRIGINNSYYFFILGLILLIPGVYYSFLFCKAKQVKSLDMRRTVYQHIPEL